MKWTWNAPDRPDFDVRAGCPGSTASRPREPCRRHQIPIDMAEEHRSARGRSRTTTRSPSASSRTRRPGSTPMGPRRVRRLRAPVQASRGLAAAILMMGMGKEAALRERPGEEAGVGILLRVMLADRGPHCRHLQPRPSHWPEPRTQGFQARNSLPALQTRAPAPQPQQLPLL